MYTHIQDKGILVAGATLAFLIGLGIPFISLHAQEVGISAESETEGSVTTEVSTTDREVNNQTKTNANVSASTNDPNGANKESERSADMKSETQANPTDNKKNSKQNNTSSKEESSAEAKNQDKSKGGFGLNIAKRATSETNANVQAALSRRISVRLNSIEKRLATISDKVDTYLDGSENTQAAAEAHANAKSSLGTASGLINSIESTTSNWISLAVEGSANLRNSFKQGKTKFKTQTKKTRTQLKTAQEELLKAVQELKAGTEVQSTTEDDATANTGNNETDAQATQNNEAEGTIGQ